MNTITYEFEYQFEIAGQEVKILEMRRPKLKDIRRVAGIDNMLDATAQMLTHLASVTPEELDEMDGYDWTALKGLVNKAFEEDKGKTFKNNIIELNYPIQVAGKSIEKLEITRPRLKDIRRTSNAENQVEAAVILLNEIVKIDQIEDKNDKSWINEIDASDWQRLRGIVENFLVKSSEHRTK